MSKTSAVYILENPAEAERLESQALLPGYELEEELDAIIFARGQRVLDAGCGSGLVSRMLARRVPGLVLEACDFSELRLKQAETLCFSSAEKRIRFFSSSLDAVTVPDALYDRVVCRYVFEHLERPQAAATEFFRILAPGGQALVIDFDGLFFNLSHDNRELAEMLELLRRGLPADLFIGRKIPRMLVQAGFEEVRWSIQAVTFEGDALLGEKQNTRQRLAFVRPIAAKLLGSDAAVDEFTELYCLEMTRPGNVVFHNKFLVTGRKPIASGP